MSSENKSISTVLAIAACALSLAASGDANWPGNQTDAYWEDVWGNVNDYYVFLNVPDATVRFRSFTTLPSNRPVWFDGSHVTFIGDDSGCGIQAGRNWNVSLTVGRDRGAGYLTIKDGRYTFTDVAYVGVGSGTTDAVGELRLEGGTVSVTACNIAAGTAGSKGAILMSGGRFNFSNTVVIGRRGNGSFEVSGGDVAVSGEMNIGGEYMKDGSDNGTGTLVIKGGTVTVNSYSSIGRTSTGTLILDGGSFVGKKDVDLGRWAGADGTLDVSNGTFTAEQNIVIGRDPGSGTINLCGGVVECTQLVVGTGSGNLNLNGGTLRARGNQGTFIQSSGSLPVKIGPGGAMFDTAGYAVTVPATLGNADGLVGNGQIGKKGAGTLTLSSSLDLGRTFKFVIDGGVGPIALIGSANTLGEGKKISVALDPVDALTNTTYVLMTGVDTTYTKETSFNLPEDNGFYTFDWTLESGTLSVSLAVSENAPVTARYGSDAWEFYNGNNTLIENAEPLAWTTYIFTGVEPAGDLETIGVGHKVVLGAAKDGDAGVTNTFSVASVANAKDVTVTSEEGCAVRLLGADESSLSAGKFTNNGTLILAGTVSVPSLTIGGTGRIVVENGAVVTIEAEHAQPTEIELGGTMKLSKPQVIGAPFSGYGTLSLSGGSFSVWSATPFGSFNDGAFKGVLELCADVRLEDHNGGLGSALVRMKGASLRFGNDNDAGTYCSNDFEIFEGTTNTVYANKANMFMNGQFSGDGEVTMRTNGERGPRPSGDNSQFAGVFTLRHVSTQGDTGFHGANATSAAGKWIIDTDNNNRVVDFADAQNETFHVGELYQSVASTSLRVTKTGTGIVVGERSGGESVINGHFTGNAFSFTKLGATSWLTLGTGFAAVAGSTFNFSAGGICFNLPAGETEPTSLINHTVTFDPSVKIRVAMTQAQYEALDLDEEYLVAKLPTNPGYKPETELLVDGTVLDTAAAARWCVRFKSLPAVGETPAYVGAVLCRRPAGLMIIVY